MKTWTALKVRQSKGSRKLACLTAYDATTARLVDAAGIPLILVGDSLAMTMLGYPNTVAATMAHMLHHTAAVTRAVRNALVVADMPFMSYRVSLEQGLTNAARFLQEAAADAVKIEGGAERADLVRALAANGIPVLGHIGLTPQSVLETGGFRVQGREAEDAERLRADARVLAEAGVFAIVLECIPATLAGTITRDISVPTIGIGAGPECDGQILVTHDMLGLWEEFQPRFVKRYARLADDMRAAFESYQKEVSEGRFPGAEHCY
jgi:3-methyl-2-oxobutanoate hydroxymethyltransferase